MDSNIDIEKQRSNTVSIDMPTATQVLVPKTGASGLPLGQEISAWRFLKATFLATLIGIACIVGLNVSIDIYGLFLPVVGREIPVYHNDRISKYLLSHRYIPENFDAAILGTSLSANLDVSTYNRQGSLRIYNASVMGANISELDPIARKLVHGGIKKIIICFSPYLVRSSGAKEVELGRKIYYGAFGSKNLFETYLVALIRQNQLMPTKFPKGQINEFGVNDYQDHFRVDDIRQRIAMTIQENRNVSFSSDSNALQQLGDLLKFFKENKVQYVGYFHPVPLEILQSKYSEYVEFEQVVRRLVADDDKLIDFNNPAFKHFTLDYSNYIDQGHLSQKGQEKITDIVLQKLKSAGK